MTDATAAAAAGSGVPYGIPMRAVAGFTAEGDNELGMEQDDLVMLMYESRDGWGEAECDGVVGWVPVAFLRPVTAQELDELIPAADPEQLRRLEAMNMYLSTYHMGGAGDTMYASRQVRKQRAAEVKRRSDGPAPLIPEEPDDSHFSFGIDDQQLESIFASGVSLAAIEVGLQGAITTKPGPAKTPRALAREKAKEKAGKGKDKPQQQQGGKREDKQAGKRGNARAPRMTIGIGEPRKLVQALWTFQASSKKQLGFRQGDVLEVLKSDRNWWLAQDRRNKRGLIPSNYVTAYVPYAGETGPKRAAPGSKSRHGRKGSRDANKSGGRRRAGSKSSDHGPAPEVPPTRTEERAARKASKAGSSAAVAVTTAGRRGDSPGKTRRGDGSPRRGRARSASTGNVVRDDGSGDEADSGGSGARKRDRRRKGSKGSRGTRSGRARDADDGGDVAGTGEGNAEDGLDGAESGNERQDSVGGRKEKSKRGRRKDRK